MTRKKLSETEPPNPDPQNEGNPVIFGCGLVTVVLVIASILLFRECMDVFDFHR